MKREKAVLSFFKRNAAYIILALCIIAIGLSITFVMINRSSSLKIEEANRIIEEPVSETPNDDNGQTPVTDPVDTEVPDTPVSNVISFVVPIENVTSIEDYTETLSYNATLKRFEAHKAIDFFAEEGTPVFAAYGGVVSKVENTLLTGTTITIDHGNGLFTVYNSLADGDKVFVGQTVLKGAVIGEASVTNRQESAEGSHLHFQVVENGVAINPYKYLELDAK